MFSNSPANSSQMQRRHWIFSAPFLVGLSSGCSGGGDYRGDDPMRLQTELEVVETPAIPASSSVLLSVRN